MVTFLGWSKKLWKILKQMEIQDHLTSLLRNLYAGQEATVRVRHGTKDWCKIGKRVYTRARTQCAKPVTAKVVGGQTPSEATQGDAL